MPLSASELEELLRLALTALRGQAGAAPGMTASMPASASAGPTLSEWLVTYRKVIAERGYNDQTIKNRTTSLRHIEAVWGALGLRSIKPVDIAAKLKRWTPHTAGRILSELRDVFVEAIAHGEAETSPAAHVKAPRAHGLRKRLTLETWQSMLTLANAGPQRWVPAMLLLALATGQRRADLAKMRFDDVVDGCLRIEQQKKARKLVGARVAIPLTLRLAATGMTLGEVIELCRGIGAPGPTLLRKAAGGPIEMSSLSARFREHILAVLPADAHKQFEWPSLHEVRSLSARTYIAEGMPPATVQTLLGHKHADMTALYLDDRGLSAADWKRVEATA
jgi:integrase